MSRIIINNKSDLSDLEAVTIVQDIVERGRISNDGKQYCYLMTIEMKSGKKYAIQSGLNKKSDTFTIYNDNQP